MILFFVLGLGAAFMKSDLSVPSAIAKGMSLYLMLAIGFKGGVQVSTAGFTPDLVWTGLAGFLLSLCMPFVAFFALRKTTTLPPADTASIAGHYGSISIVTFIAATQALKTAGIPFEGYMIAVAALMEAPAIFSALRLASRYDPDTEATPWHHILANGSVVLLAGAFFIGMITGQEGMHTLESFVVSPFKGVLCLFLLDMGLVAGRGLMESRHLLRGSLLAFGLYIQLALFGNRSSEYPRSLKVKCVCVAFSLFLGCCFVLPVFRSSVFNVPPYPISPSSQPIRFCRILSALGYPVIFELVRRAYEPFLSY
jgi:hypothetical protein